MTAFILLASAAWRLEFLGGIGEGRKLQREQEVLTDVRRTILNRYVEDVDEQKLFYGALRGMVGVLDAHSQFLSPDEFEEMNRRTTGKFGGLGIEISQDSHGQLVVVTPLMGTPAFRAGILPGDRILKIDGKSTDQMALDQAARSMRGDPDSSVQLQVLHEGDSDPEDITIVREIIHVESVKLTRVLDGEPKIGYVLLSDFQEDSAAALDRALTLLEGQGIRGLVLDLRMNYGGLLDSSVGVCGLFLKSGLIVTTRGRTSKSVLGESKDEEKFEADGANTHPDCPMAILVDRTTASAAEITAGALKDHGRAVLVGEKTYGKGSVQTLLPVDVSSGKTGALKLTTAYYYLPNGERIHGKGIEPDFVVPRTREQTRGLIKDRQRLWLKENNPGARNGKTPKKDAAAPESKTGEPAAEPKAPPEKAPPEDPAKGPKDEEKPFVDEQLNKAVEYLRGKIKGGETPKGE